MAWRWLLETMTNRFPSLVSARHAEEDADSEVERDADGIDESESLRKKGDLGVQTLMFTDFGNPF